MVARGRVTNWWESGVSEQRNRELRGQCGIIICDI